ncbi:MAG: NACHT domain-containing protein [Verrucomicrobiota bacterium]
MPAKRKPTNLPFSDLDPEDLTQVMRVVFARRSGGRNECADFSPGVFSDPGTTTFIFDHPDFTDDFFSTHFDAIDQNQSLPPIPNWIFAKISEQSALEEEFAKRRGELDLVWDAAELSRRVRAIPPLLLRYFPKNASKGVDSLAKVAEFEQLEKDYRREFSTLHNKVQFVGMSVYKEEATRAIDLDKVYIPLELVDENCEEPKDLEPDIRIDPLRCLERRGGRHVILGDPGSGKSTLLRFLGLAGYTKRIQDRYGAAASQRLPIFLILRQYADALRENLATELLDCFVERARTDLGLQSINRAFLEHHLIAGNCLILLDGIDELPAAFKDIVRQQVQQLLGEYPNNCVVVTSRIVGYEKEVRYEGLGFDHHKVARLLPKEIERFVSDWYQIRVKPKKEREEHIADLTRVIADEENEAIRDLARNPLLLTIACLVHRIDAVLPDERVVLYQKCTETLLNTWHNWKFRGDDKDTGVRRGQTERRNRARMEHLAYWMHRGLDAQDEEGNKKRSVAPLEAIQDELTNYIEQIERPRHEDPVELAKEFLKFVRERAGLLIEVGDRQYSFVHPTFQEYLAASDIRGKIEIAGVDLVWEIIKDFAAKDHWHDVIRLLVGELRNPRAQEQIIERLIPADPFGAGSVELALLTAGCLLDGGDGAQFCIEEIIDGLIQAASVCEDQQKLQAIINTAERLRKRNINADEIFRELLQEKFTNGKTGGANNPLAN